MKSIIFFVSVFITSLMFSFTSYAQIGNDRDLQYYRFPDKRGLNTFETSKFNTIKFDGLKVMVGGAASLQFQGLNHSNDANSLIDLGKNFNLATYNLTFNAQLANGVRMHLTSYLTSRHHTESWIKSGYLQIDKLDFIKKGFLKKLMKSVTIKIGHMETNYGDAHFRRSDNASTLYNPFIGNLIMDGFTTEIGAEVYYKKNGIIAMAGFTNGKLNQDVKSPGKNSLSFVGKLGVDMELKNDMRVRLTGSIYTTSKNASIHLYGGDRAGSRFYSVMQTTTSDVFTSGRWKPGFKDNITSIMINPFVKIKGLEIFGVYETTKGGDFKGAAEDRTWKQISGDVVYRFGEDENLYFGISYNRVSGKLANSDPNDVSINRIQFGAGWFLTNNILAKFMYINQNYNDFAPTNVYSGGNFNGFIIETAIKF